MNKKKVTAPEVPVQEQFNKKICKSVIRMRKIVLTLVLTSVLTSIASIVSTYKYNQLIKKEKLFLDRGEKILYKIDKNYKKIKN